ncbi:MAG: bifunctional molybdenum cofactor biosynthesis protein MoaC/MoaB, partial [Bacteroidota bacterium]
MRDISSKARTLRTAVARARLTVGSDTIRAIKEQRVPKGDPLPVARIAAIQAAKNTSQIIPFCHPVAVEFADCRIELGDRFITVETEVKAVDKTGVEMEALTAASVAALTLYDMLKMIDAGMEIQSVQLLKKTGGKSDFQDSVSRKLTAGVLVLSDSRSRGEGEDQSGRILKEGLQELGFSVPEYAILPDEPGTLEAALIRLSDERKVDLLLLTGGTGIGPRDTTPEVVARVVDREVPGIGEALRSYGSERTPTAVLSRAAAGIRGSTIIVSVPGSPSGVRDSLAV